MSEKDFLMNDSNKFEILKLAYEKQLEAAIFHLELANKIFSWSNAILLAILGFVLSQRTTLMIQDRLFLTSAVLILFMVVFLWQNRNRIETIEHAANVARIDGLFHLNEPGYFGGEEPIIKKWHSNLPKWRAQIGIIHYNIAVLAMTAIVIIALWI